MFCKYLITMPVYNSDNDCPFFIQCLNEVIVIVNSLLMLRYDNNAPATYLYSCVVHWHNGSCPVGVAHKCTHFLMWSHMCSHGLT